MATDGDGVCGDFEIWCGIEKKSEPVAWSRTFDAKLRVRSTAGADETRKVMIRQDCVHMYCTFHFRYAPC